MMKKICVCGIFLWAPLLSWSFGSQKREPSSRGKGLENSGSITTTPHLKRTQSVAPELEKQISEFRGNRSPPGSVLDLKLAPLQNSADGKSWQVLEVPEGSPFQGRVKPGDHINLEDLQ